MTDLSKNIQALREKKAVVEMGGGEAAIEKQIAMGKLTARDRILSLLDKNSFHEYSFSPSSMLKPIISLCPSSSIPMAICTLLDTTL